MERQSVNLGIRMIPFNKMQPFALNPRRQPPTPTSLDELVASIADLGVLQPVLVRPQAGSHEPPDDAYEIVYGHRRVAAVERLATEWIRTRKDGQHPPSDAHRGMVPAAVVLDLSDADALTMAFIENAQREDMHPLDESDAIRDLKRLDPTLTVRGIADRLKLSARRVQRRMRYERLGPLVRSAFLANVITTDHADDLAMITDVALQERALIEGCFQALGATSPRAASLKKLATASPEDLDALRLSVAPLRSLHQWIHDNIRQDPTDGAVQEEFPELAQLATTTDVATLLQVSDHSWKVPTGVLQREEYREVTGKKSTHGEAAIVVHGGPMRLVRICRDRACRAHWPDLMTRQTPADTARAARFEAQAARQRKAQAAWSRTRRSVWPALVTHATTHAKLSGDLVRRVIGEYATRELLRRAKGVKLTDANAAGVLALHVLERSRRTRSELSTAARLVGFDLGKWERDERARQKSASKKATAKSGRAKGGAK